MMLVVLIPLPMHMHKYFDIFHHAFLALFIDELVEYENYCMFFSHAKSLPEFNGVSNIAMEEGSMGENIIDIELMFASKSLPTALWVTNYDSPRGLESYLKDKGYEVKETMQWVIKEHVRDDSTFNSTYDLVMVSSNDQLEDFIRIYSMLWPDPEGQVAQVFRTKLFDQRYCENSKLYVAYADGKPVSIAGCSKVDDAAFLHSIGTIPDYRNRGYSSALIHFASKSSGADTILYGGDLRTNNFSILQKIGFHELMQVRVYRK